MEARGERHPAQRRRTLAAICGVELPLKNGAATPRKAAGAHDRGGRPKPRLGGKRASWAAAARKRGRSRASRAGEAGTNPGADARLGPRATELPYLTGRGVTREQAEPSGSACAPTGKTIPGRVGIPIHNADGQLVGYAGRWVGAGRAHPGGRGKVQAAGGISQECRAVQPAPGQGLPDARGRRGLLRHHPPVRRLAGADGRAHGRVGLGPADRASQEHCPALRFVTVCLDGDEPGRKAGETVAARLARHWWVRIASLPRRHAAGHDAAGSACWPRSAGRGRIASLASPHPFACAPPLVGRFLQPAVVPAAVAPARLAPQPRDFGSFGAGAAVSAAAASPKALGYGAKLPTARRQGKTASRAASAQRLRGNSGPVKPYSGDSRTLRGGRFLGIDRATDRSGQSAARIRPLARAVEDAQGSTVSTPHPVRDDVRRYDQLAGMRPASGMAQVLAARPGGRCGP